MPLPISIEDLLSSKPLTTVDPRVHPMVAFGHEAIWSQVGGKPRTLTRPTTPPLHPGVDIPRERGASNVAMTGDGRDEVRDAARELASVLRAKRPNAKVCIYTSWWDRAESTAKILVEELHAFHPEVEHLNALAPQSLGGLEGQPSSAVKPAVDALRTTNTRAVPPGRSSLSGAPGESTNAYKNRVLPAIAKMLREVDEDPNLIDIIAAHSSDQRLVRAWISAGGRSNFTLDPKYMRSHIPGFRVDGIFKSHAGQWLYRTNVLPRAAEMRLLLFRHGDTAFAG